LAGTCAGLRRLPRPRRPSRRCARTSRSSRASSGSRPVFRAISRRRRSMWRLPRSRAGRRRRTPPSQSGRICCGGWQSTGSAQTDAALKAAPNMTFEALQDVPSGCTLARKDKVITVSFTPPQAPGTATAGSIFDAFVRHSVLAHAEQVRDVRTCAQEISRHARADAARQQSVTTGPAVVLPGGTPSAVSALPAGRRAVRSSDSADPCSGWREPSRG